MALINNQNHIFVNFNKISNEFFSSLELILDPVYAFIDKYNSIELTDDVIKFLNEFNSDYFDSKLYDQVALFFQSSEFNEFFSDFTKLDKYFKTNPINELISSTLNNFFENNLLNEIKNILPDVLQNYHNQIFNKADTIIDNPSSGNFIKNVFLNLKSFSSGGRIDFPTPIIAGDASRNGGINREWIFRDEQLKQTVQMAINGYNNRLENLLQSIDDHLSNLHIDTKISGSDLKIALNSANYFYNQRSK